MKTWWIIAVISLGVGVGPAVSTSSAQLTENVAEMMIDHYLDLKRRINLLKSENEKLKAQLEKKSSAYDKKAKEEYLEKHKSERRSEFLEVVGKVIEQLRTMADAASAVSGSYLKVSKKAYEEWKEAWNQGREEYGELIWDAYERSGENPNSKENVGRHINLKLEGLRGGFLESHEKAEQRLTELTPRLGTAPGGYESLHKAVTQLYDAYASLSALAQTPPDATKMPESFREYGDRVNRAMDRFLTVDANLRQVLERIE